MAEISATAQTFTLTKFPKKGKNNKILNSSENSFTKSSRLINFIAKILLQNDSLFPTDF